jgi:hypothetical protein
VGNPKPVDKVVGKAVGSLGLAGDNTGYLWTTWGQLGVRLARLWMDFDLTEDRLNG